MANWWDGVKLVTDPPNPNTQRVDLFGNPMRNDPAPAAATSNPKPAAASTNTTTPKATNTGVATTTPKATTTPSSAPAPGTQASAQAWINDSRSGQGGMDAYVAKQQAKYNAALASGDTAMLNALSADMQRVGYNLNSPQQQQPAPPTAAYGGLLDSLSAGRDAQIAGANAGIDATLNQQITQLQKAYQDAVMQGQLSVAEAQTAFEAQKKQVEQQAYQDAQLTNLAGEDRGIQNSQQMLGLMQGDASRKEGLINQNLTQRDKQIADIQTRLRNLGTQKDLDIASATAQAGYSKVGAEANANAQYNQNLFDFQSQDYFNQQQQQFNQQNMNTQQQYNLQNMAVQQKYNTSNMSTQQKYQLAQIQQNFKNDLEKMKVGQSYDMDKISVNFENQLRGMAVQNGYDNARLNTQIAAEKNKLITQLNAEKNSYETARARELAKYTPGTPEYAIREAQLKDAHDSAVSEIHTKTLYESQINTIMEQAKEIGYAKPDASKVKTESDMAKYNAQMEIYSRYQSLINGSANPSNLMGTSGTGQFQFAPQNNSANTNDAYTNFLKGNWLMW